MGVYMSCFPIHCDTDARSLAHVENNHQNNTEHSQYEDINCLYKERSYSYPFPKDPTEIDR
jgi:hypothetical protein